MSFVRACLCACVIAGAFASGACSGGSGSDIKRAPGFDGKTITVGAITTVDGVLSPVGRAITAGNRLYWDELNAQGGVAGKYPVELRVGDARDFESVAVVEYDAMVDSVVLLNQIQYTRSIRAILPRLKMQDVVALPGSRDADWIGEPNLLPIGAPDDIQAINGIAQYVEEKPAKRNLCSLWEDDTYGRWGFDGLKFAVSQLGLSLDAQRRFGPIEQNFGPALDELQSARCEAVVFSGLPFHTRALLSQAQARGFAPRWIILSRGWQTDLAQGEPLSTYMAETVRVVAEGPAWGDDSVPGMKRMLSAVARYGAEQQPDLWFTYGYAQSWLAHRVFEEAVARHDLSRSGMLTAARSLGKVDFGGLVGAYTYGDGPADRHPPRGSTVFTVDAAAPGALSVVAELQSDIAMSYGFSSRQTGAANAQRTAVPSQTSDVGQPGAGAPSASPAPVRAQTPAPQAPGPPAGVTYTGAQGQAQVNAASLTPSDLTGAWQIQTDISGSPDANATACGWLSGRTVFNLATDAVGAYIAGQTLAFFSNATAYTSASGAIDCSERAAGQFQNPADVARAFGPLFVNPDDVTGAPFQYPQVADGSFAGTLTGKVAAGAATIDVTLLIVTFRQGNVTVVIGSARSRTVPPADELGPLINLVIARVKAAQ